MNKVLCGVGDGHVLREVVCIHSDSLVCSFDVGGFEWRLADDERVHDNAQRPDVDLVGVTLLALKHLRRYIVGSTANCALSLAIELQLGRKTKVTNLDLHLLVKEEVAKLEISVDDAMTV